MNDWCMILNDFLNLAQKPILENAGSITALEAKIKAENEFEVSRKIQDPKQEKPPRIISKQI